LTIRRKPIDSILLTSLPNVLHRAIQYYYEKKPDNEWNKAWTVTNQILD